MSCLVFLEAKFHFLLFASHIKGSNIELADALSSDNFLSLDTLASSEPTPLPQELLDLTIIAKPDWTSMHCRTLFLKCTSSFNPPILSSEKHRVLLSGSIHSSCYVGMCHSWLMRAHLPKWSSPICQLLGIFKSLWASRPQNWRDGAMDSRRKDGVC